MAATEGWWRLGMPEAVLLPWLVGSLPPQAARDYPVYLPHGSPTVSGRDQGAASSGAGGGACLVLYCAPLQVPHRLLTLTLLRGLELCLLCGPRPPLGQLDPQVRPTVAALPLHVPSLSATMQAMATQAPPRTSPDFTAISPLPPPNPRSCWNAGGSLCWSPSGPACHWALGHYPMGSRCTAIFLGKAQWLGPGLERPFALPAPHGLTVLFPSLLLLHLELRRCLFTVEPSKDKGAWGSNEWEGLEPEATLSRCSLFSRAFP